MPGLATPGSANSKGLKAAARPEPWHHGLVDLAARDVHRSLGYLAALDAQGHRPTPTELDAYASQPDRRPATHENMFFSTFASSVQRLLAMREVEPEETMTAHFTRLHWASVDGGRLRVTGLGRAIYRALEQQSLEPENVFDVILEATDSTAFARVVGRIADAGPALLVEPYFRLDVFMPITEFTGVTRVLGSERTDKTSRDVLGLAIEKLILDRPFEVRVASREVHDRYVIPDSGSVQFIGASLNGLGQVATAMGVINDGSEEIRRLYESIWDASDVLATAKRPSAASKATASSGLSKTSKKTGSTAQKGSVKKK